MSEERVPSPEAGSFQNKLLQNLRPEVVQRLRLKPVRLDVHHQIENIGEPIRNLYFLESGLGSMTAMFHDGSQVEIGLFGYESVIGVSALMGTRRSLNSIYMQFPGHGYMSPVAAAAEEFRRGEQFQGLCLRYVQAQLLQAAQSAGCNARHPILQRLARWLLLCADRIRSNHFDISHDFLSHMLGVRRAGVSVALAELVATGSISNDRGVIHITDQPRLEAHACECYRTVRNYLESYTEYDSGQTA